jgi:Domain of unknown function (DUF5916)
VKFLCPLFSIILALLAISSMISTLRCYMKFILTTYLLFLPLLHFSQTPAFDVYTLQEKIKIDGILEEEIWKKTPQVQRFWQYFPKDTVKAQYLTEVWLAYDKQNLYIAARCQTSGRNYVVPSLRRDYRAGGNDNISFLLDTFDDRTNAFLFGMNPLGVMREATISNGGQNPDPQYFSTAWDNKWNGESKIYDKYWTTEVVIPLTTLRFKEGSTRWNFNCYRFDMQTNEQQTWMQIPQNQVVFNLAFMGQMNFPQPLGKPGANLSVIPYVYAGSLRDFEVPQRSTGEKFSTGLDAKIGLTAGLNLDLTVNPDFSQVEADRQIINLSRFDISYPEQRQFFLENADLFSSFGNENLSPFFSRRIGIAYDTTTGTFVQNAIQYGARISGKLDNNWRLGLLNTQTSSDLVRGISGANFTVAALQRKLFSRSNLSFLMINKEKRDVNIGDGQAYNRVLGLEYNLQSSDNVWFGKFFYHQIFSPQVVTDKWAHRAFLNYNVRKISLTFDHLFVGKGYDAEVGFVPRNDYARWAGQALLGVYPRGFFNQMFPGIVYEQSSIPNFVKKNNLPGSVTDQFIGIVGESRLRNTGSMEIEFGQFYTYLFEDFDPTLSKNNPLKAGTEYRYWNGSLSYGTDMRKVFNAMTQLRLGEYFDGNILGLSGNINYRFQPYGQLSINYAYNQIRTSQGSGNLFLIGPRTDVTFSKSLFWTTVVQYNSRFDNLNINSRLQWRFAPVSDLFFVYTDNYFASDRFESDGFGQRYLAYSAFQPRNRAFIFKMTYWLNL